MTRRAYYTVLPSQLIEDVRLTSTARTVYAIVENLTHKTGVCFASNDYLLDLMGGCYAECTLQRAIALLERCGYIKREIISGPGKQNERKIIISNDWRGREKMCGGGRKNDTTVVAKMQPPHIYDEKQSNKSNVIITRTRANELFERLWGAYPKQRRGSKHQAYDEFVHAIGADGIPPEQILTKVAEYANSTEVVDRGMAQYLYRWLANRGYEAQYKPAKAGQTAAAPVVVMPPLGVRGCEIWTARNFGFRNKYHIWTFCVRTALDKWRVNHIQDNVILDNIRRAGNMGDEMAAVIYFLGAGGDVDALERDFVRQWWRRQAYQPIRAGRASLDEKQAEWREICAATGLPEFARYDPTADFEYMAEFYKKMGWN